MVLYVPNLVQLIGLGLAVDYSLLIVHRFRQELVNKERPVDDAIVATMATAGRTVVFRASLSPSASRWSSIVPVPFVRSLGFAGLVVPLVSIVAALTLQPALLSLLGRRGMWRARLLRLRSKSTTSSTALWSRLARTVMRRPVVVLVGSAAVLVAAAVPAVWLQLTPGSVVGHPAGHPVGPRPGSPA